MLFNSYTFIFAFLPVVLVGFHLTSKHFQHQHVLQWLILSSLFFYGWWNPAYLLLIVGSILFNYLISDFLRQRQGKPVLIFGITLNLLLLGYYKYANFFIENLNQITNNNYHLETIILPLAISFFTFQQITYLVDAYRGITKDHNFTHYCLFVTFFPQLIAGPIVHHKEMLPQFLKRENMGLRIDNFSIGLTIFIIGLFKKVVIADTMADYATPTFSVAEQGATLTLLEAWGGALAYSLQLYFDFSGYSDMAIGIARIFNITLPINFFSPYKAHNIIDFWRRWHITLSTFLRDYIYIPLGGNRKGGTRQLTNLMITMLLGGLWHGAGWSFILWGGLHGLLLIVNHSWLALKKHLAPPSGFQTRATITVARTITLLTIIASWVLFRAETLDGAITMYHAMIGANGIALPKSMSGIADLLQTTLPNIEITTGGVGIFSKGSADAKIILTLLIALYLPNTLEWMGRVQPALNLEQYTQVRYRYRYRISPWNSTVAEARWIALAAIIAILSLSSASEFLYFQF